MMPKLTVDVPDELAGRLKRIAAAQHKTVQELALERLRSLVEPASELPPGSGAALLRAMHAPPRLEVGDVEELEQAIASGRLPDRSGDVFPDHGQ